MEQLDQAVPARRRTTMNPEPGSHPHQTDIREVLREKTELRSLRSLEKQGFRNVKVLTLESIEQIITQIVDRALERHLVKFKQEERDRLESETKAELLSLLKEHERVVASHSQLAQSKERLAEDAQRLRRELEESNRTLDQLRKREIAPDTFVLSPQAMASMESRIRKLFQQLMDEERRMRLIEDGPSCMKGMDEFEQRLLEMVSGLLDEERHRIYDKEMRAQDQTIDILERRVGKLTAALQQSEEALRKLAKAKAIDPGLASIYGDFQGLNPDELNAERKKELLKVVFIQNLELQKKTVPKERVNASAIPS